MGKTKTQVFKTSFEYVRQLFEDSKDFCLQSPVQKAPASLQGLYPMLPQTLVLDFPLNTFINSTTLITSFKEC